MSLILLGILNSQVTGAAAGAYDLLETQVLSSSASSVTFTGLDSYTDYKHLQIRWVASTTGASEDSVDIRFNSDSASNYSDHLLRGDGGSVISYARQSDKIQIGSVRSTPTSSFGAGIVDILDFSNTNKYTTTRTLNGNVGDTGTKFIEVWSGNWRNTAAVSSILIKSRSNNLPANSRFSIYGVK